MIKNQWYGIMESKEIGKKPIGVTRMNEKLVLWRDHNGALKCIYDKCCHRGAKLSLGKVIKDELVCPFHAFTYDGTGQVTTIPANGKVAKVPERYSVHGYKVKEAYGLVWLWYGNQFDEHIPEIPFFEELKTGFFYKTFSEVWEVHYTRAIENQLDVVHVPIVHATTIGKGGRTIVNGPVVKWDKNLMTIYIQNIVDDGKTVAKKTKDIENYKEFFKLQYQVPNAWQNCISDKVRVFAIFVPVDETHTKIYMRFYQKFVPIPIIGTGIAALSNVFNRVVLHQDRHVVLTQVPIKTEVHMNENLIQGDLSIIEFRRRRDQLKKESNIE